MGEGKESQNIGVEVLPWLKLRWSGPFGAGLRGLLVGHQSTGRNGERIPPPEREQPSDTRDLYFLQVIISTGQATEPNSEEAQPHPCPRPSSPCLP